MIANLHTSKCAAIIELRMCKCVCLSGKYQVGRIVVAWSLNQQPKREIVGERASLSHLRQLMKAALLLLRHPPIASMLFPASYLPGGYRNPCRQRKSLAAILLC